jgi:hypothetical protein
MTTSRDDRKSPTFGPYHVHFCERCGVGIACFDGPQCDNAETQGHCSQACHDHKTREGSRVGQPAVGLD